MAKLRCFGLDEYGGDGAYVLFLFSESQVAPVCRRKFSTVDEEAAQRLPKDPRRGVI
ncbi:MAG TPA: hypothetical protein VE865_02910 [Bradyrhizobium sp.]|nr:hypothetical protein [Bradyrhizobium sp.]